MVAAAMDEECRSENSYEPSIAEDDEWQEVTPIGLDTGFSFDGIAGESLFGVASLKKVQNAVLNMFMKSLAIKFQLQQNLSPWSRPQNLLQLLAVHGIPCWHKLFLET